MRHAKRTRNLVYLFILARACRGKTKRQKEMRGSVGEEKSTLSLFSLLSPFRATSDVFSPFPSPIFPLFVRARQEKKIKSRSKQRQRGKAVRVCVGGRATGKKAQRNSLSLSLLLLLLLSSLLPSRARGSCGSLRSGGLRAGGDFGSARRRGCLLRRARRGGGSSFGSRLCLFG